MVTANSTKTLLNWMNSTSFEDIPLDVRHTTVLALYDDSGCNMEQAKAAIWPAP
jgi:hypothetical protein